ncbi:hypothetical protein [Lentilitoribacter sp. EG35]|uniref:hypothetical protein n=1 Tax=Lentilitoribacter sp. EG35 TaxID=3234192 RepID=UPI0034602B82
MQTINQIENLNGGLEKLLELSLEEANVSGDEMLVHLIGKAALHHRKALVQNEIKKLNSVQQNAAITH